VTTEIARRKRSRCFRIEGDVRPPGQRVAAEDGGRNVKPKAVNRPGANLIKLFTFVINER
jgi:hypothetical protein